MWKEDLSAKTAENTRARLRRLFISASFIFPFLPVNKSFSSTIYYLMFPIPRTHSRIYGDLLSEYRTNKNCVSIISE